MKLLPLFHFSIHNWKLQRMQREECSEQLEASIQVTLSFPTNQRPVSRSRDHSRPIRCQYPGHVINLNQSEATIQVTWSFSTNQRPISRSRDHSRPIRGHYPGHVNILNQSEATIQVTWSFSTNQMPVSRSRDQSWPIRCQYPCHVIILEQSDASIQVTWSILTNRRKEESSDRPGMEMFDFLFWKISIFMRSNLSCCVLARASLARCPFVEINAALYQKTD